jgi:L-amino acid N-acyltransferase YncA
MERTVIREAIPADSGRLAEIYNHYILNSIVTFEEQVVSAQEMSSRVEETQASSLPWLVAEYQRQVVGYAYASKWKGRCAYRYSVESTVYLAPEATGRGIGTRLYEELFARLRDQGMHVIIGGIALPNPGSIALHEKFGFRKVAHFEEVGFKFNKWIDVGYWQVSFAGDRHIPISAA